MTVRLALFASLALMIATLHPADGAAAESADLRQQLETLAAQNGFQLRGTTHIGQAPTVLVSGTLRQRLMALLAAYNFVIVANDDGTIGVVRIVGLKGPPPDLSRRVTVAMTKRGSGHFLDAVIMGRQGEHKRLSLMLDTGASMIVLPTSLIDELGFREDDLKKTVLQTANGKIEGQTAILKSVQIGQAFERDIAVAFVEDEKLGTNKLLGMSYLSRFVLTIDDQAHRLILERRPYTKVR